SKFQEARQVMSRYDTLMLTREDLVPTTQQNQDSTEKARAQLNPFTEQSNDTLLHYNTLAQLRSQLDKSHTEGIIWESRWAHIQNTAAKKTLLLCTIKMATINLYQSVCKRAKDTGDLPVAPEDPPKQLEKVP
ncbi:coiled-coil domain-containing protein 42-like, partial [Oncorhynchus nerka]|uniref:coiled-coil domain-containing protein 42-like n=1 Tax=Oncorhynchus nerka TaxID=8023 RepID=UPI00113221C6